MSDKSAIEQVMATRYVAHLQSETSAKLVCFVEDSTPTHFRVYVGEDHPDHTVRLRTFRVHRSGRVWVDADQTSVQDRWVPVE